MSKITKYIGTDKLEFPKIDFLLTISKPVEKSFRYVKYCSAVNYYGYVTILLEPNERNAGFEFEDKVKYIPEEIHSNKYKIKGWFPKEYITSVEEGIKSAMHSGLSVDFPCVDIKCSLLDVEYDKIFSNKTSFRVASRMAFIEAFKEAEPIILEPIMDVKISCNSQSLDNLCRDIEDIRGEVYGYDVVSDKGIIKAFIPDYEIQNSVFTKGYLIDKQLNYRKVFHHHNELPSDMASKIIALYSKAKEE